MRVLLSKSGKTNYQVLIEDDGVGFARQQKNTGAGEHIGLKIMQKMEFINTVAYGRYL